VKGTWGFVTMAIFAQWCLPRPERAPAEPVAVELPAPAPAARPPAVVAPLPPARALPRSRLAATAPRVQAPDGRSFALVKARVRPRFEWTGIRFEKVAEGAEGGEDLCNPRNEVWHRATLENFGLKAHQPSLCGDMSPVLAEFGTWNKALSYASTHNL
jgi:hypothetical protein